ncbi:MAG TPA: TonB-dependent receptor plug domain-containing protein, partial [Hyphomicrobiales bacterium]|nr:TonB-dependent receptor plug domain-containing protein [Hyphomicrobiales bacterium]
MKIRHPLLAALAAGATLAPLSVAVLAAERGFTLEEITVTARRAEESLKDTPIAITAVSAGELDARNEMQIDAISRFVPNVNFSYGGTSSGSSSAAVVFIRGVGQNDFLPSTEPGVGLYVDGVYYGRTLGS